MSSMDHPGARAPSSPDDLSETMMSSMDHTGARTPSSPDDLSETVASLSNNFYDDEYHGPHWAKDSLKARRPIALETGGHSPLSRPKGGMLDQSLFLLGDEKKKMKNEEKEKKKTWPVTLRLATLDRPGCQCRVLESVLAR
ncbi:unnamed protein product [Pleuronectes platessa]|uniref:Uncharacterized protein n=1 Tax=Pleuronectes platessa TaxID=8262 RepID=A0A9N7VD69_PLEPL|nr:unnamed protein product [Pleuronectes platessa]